MSFVMSSLTCFGLALRPQTRCGWLDTDSLGRIYIGTAVYFTAGKCDLPVTDAYSTQYELQMSQKSSALLLALGAMPQTCDLEQAAQLPEYLKEPVDYFGVKTGALSASVQEQTLLVSGKLRYCMLGTDADGAPVYFEQAQDVAQEYQLETKADSYLTELFITVQDCQYGDPGEKQTAVSLQVAGRRYGFRGYTCFIHYRNQSG